jgi:hypothetical protein
LCVATNVGSWLNREEDGNVSRSKTWFVVGVFCLVAIGLTREAAAQDAPAAEVSGGYQFFSGKGENEDEWENFPKGWYFDAAANMANSIGIVGQVSGNYKHFDDDDFDFKLHTFMGGVRASSRGLVRAFGQFLVGGANFNASDDTDSASETDLAIQLGAGVNIVGASGVGLRLGADYLRVFAKDGGELSSGEDLNGLRVVVGVVFGLGQ